MELDVPMSTSDATILLEFRAGIAILANGEVTPDRRKGMVRLISSEELLHFQWLNRQGGTAIGLPELDLVVFPNEADVSQDVQPGSRYLQLKFKDTTRQSFFFWMQEPSADQDDELCSLAQQLINMDDRADPMSEAASEDLQGAIDRLEEEISNREVPTGGVQPALTQEYLAAILSGIANDSQNTQQQQRLPTLSEILTPQNLVPLLDDEAVKKKLGELIEHLPKDHQDEAQKQAHNATVATVRSAPLRNQVRVLSHALASGQLDFSQLGLEHLGFSAADFLRSIQKMADQSKRQ